MYTNEFIASNEFLQTYEWRRARMAALEKYSGRCMCCGAESGNGVYMCVDHIKPRKTHPELALDISNLQILCNVCNHGKGNWSVKDWRENETFIVTEYWIKQNATTPGGAGYTDAQMKALGIKKTKGWVKKCAGMHITERQKKLFEDAKHERSKKYVERQEKKKEAQVKAAQKIANKEAKKEKRNHNPPKVTNKCGNNL